MADLPVCRCAWEFVRKGYFFSFLPPQRCNHILAPSQWQLVGMHIVIKQFPVCKCPVYTFLPQSLSLDKLLEYEKSSHTMKNENSRTSIKKSIVPTLSCRHACNWCHREDPELNTTTRAPAHTHKLQKDQGYYSQQLHNSLLIKGAVEKLLWYNEEV